MDTTTKHEHPQARYCPSSYYPGKPNYALLRYRPRKPRVIAGSTETVNYRVNVDGYENVPEGHDPKPKEDS